MVYSFICIKPFILKIMFMYVVYDFNCYHYFKIDNDVLFGMILNIILPI